MADTSAGGEDTGVRQINKSHEPTGVRACSPLQFPQGKGMARGVGISVSVFHAVSMRLSRGAGGPP